MRRSVDLSPRARAATVVFGLRIEVLPEVMRLRMRLYADAAEYA